MNVLIPLLCLVGWIATCLFAYSLCRVAGEADEQMGLK